jgi:hypothetical protein
MREIQRMCIVCGKCNECVALDKKIRVIRLGLNPRHEITSFCIYKNI